MCYNSCRVLVSVGYACFVNVDVHVVVTIDLAVTYWRHGRQQESPKFT